MARLYDPTEGNIYFQGKDIRSYTSAERADKIGFILQDPILFQGTVLENLMYGNEMLQHLTPEDIEQHIAQLGLKKLLDRFDSGLQTEIGTNETISLGQKQLIAFMRAVLRRPQLLILDEATANIDTVSEQLLEEILNHLPHDTTKVIIAHRLNTIENSDDIFFVNSGGIVKAGSSAEAYDMLQNGARLS
jgi:ATP-binding cassette subfamily B protein